MFSAQKQSSKQNDQSLSTEAYLETTLIMLPLLY